MLALQGLIQIITDKDFIDKTFLYIRDFTDKDIVFFPFFTDKAIFTDQAETNVFQKMLSCPGRREIRVGVLHKFSEAAWHAEGVQLRCFHS